MTAQLIMPEEWTAQPWKNGLGVTHEVWRFPDRADYDVRVSVAQDTTPAPFSRFPGYRRWSVLIEPAPIVLMTAEGRRELSRIGDLIELDGGAALESTALPAGPTKLLNVLAKAGFEVGIGVPAFPVWFAFAIEVIDPQPALARWHARVFDPATRVNDHVLWIRRV